MNYKYEFSFIEMSNGSKVLTINLPKEIELVSAFLSGINRNEEWYIEGIMSVLSGSEEYIERDGEFYGLEIKKDFTRVHDVFGMGEECIIETSELKELIKIWAEENKKYLTK
jgi:hypothetical protein